MNRRAILAAAIVLAIGLFLRLDAFTSSLWIDEFGAFWVAAGDFHTMLDRSWAAYGQTPLYYVLPWVSMQAFGETEAALRLPSLVLGCLSLFAVYSCSRAIGGPTAGLYAAGLFWLSVPGVEYTVNARPYSLVLFTVAVALAGFASAVRFGTSHARLAWVVGGAAVAWTHYLHYPIVAGLYVAYAALPTLRARYAWRQFAVDGVAQLALVSLSTVKMLTLLSRREALSWLPDFNYAVVLEPIWPLLAGIVLGIVQLSRREEAPVAGGLRAALLICLAFQGAVIAGASLVGINLLTGRYVLSMLIPAVVLVGTTIARTNTESVIAILVVFAVASGAVYQRTKVTRGSFSGIGYQNWRTAVDDLSARIDRDPTALVLFRSGYVEEDFVPLGTPPPGVFAPLRSPGRPPFPTMVVPLNFRWAHPAREEYFAQVIAPKVEHASHFFVIGARADATVGNYMTRVAAWVDSQWPAKYRVRRTDYGGVELLEFLLSSPGEK